MSEALARRLALKPEGGTGRPIVLVHGFGADRLSWLANQGALAASGQVFTLDLPGHGREPLVERSFAELADALAEGLDAAGLEGATLVGHSLGAAIALVLAANHPDKVGALVLIAPAGLGAGVDADFLESFPKLTQAEETEALLQRLVTRPRLINRHMVSHVLEQLGDPERREALAGVARILLEDGAALGEAVATVAASDLPRLVIWGAEDRINPLDEARLVRFGGTRHILPAAGHMPHVESAPRVNEWIASFLAPGAS
ncbi:hypothetical protein GCM10011390_16710 [Aureimonas endophytica]|uniref:AB hydrolase-1 domain-containing protein n=1 Tax=Aureimonas endophytica TaxID=2027858 RepID=A0A916ZHN2_9HYPH|nr:alpha/beta fold hydrolase [Aureimonas endophytica]GGD98581.1 hypothetical protein GCM10011390_16710 [Aureimonas endophytica]